MVHNIVLMMLALSRNVEARALFWNRTACPVVYVFVRSETSVEQSRDAGRLTFGTRTPAMTGTACPSLTRPLRTQMDLRQPLSHRRTNPCSASVEAAAADRRATQRGRYSAVTR